MDPLPADIDYDRALDRAVRLLARRARSRWEIRDRLRRAGFDDHVVAKVDARLVDLNILNDDAFAEEAVEVSEGRGFASAAIRTLLESRGVGHETITSALAQSESTDAERALEVARRRARTYGDIPPSEAFRRLYGFLLRKGYEEDLVAEVCRRVLGEP